MAGAYDVAAPTLELVPELVVEIPSAANGGVVLNDDGSMSVRYEIRDAATWSDGMPVVGAHFAPTLDLEQGLCRSDSDAAVEFEVEDVGAKTIVVRSEAPTLQYETLFTWVAPSHALAGTDLCSDWIDVTWPAAGPFVVDEVVRGDRITLVRNEDYWMTDIETGLQLPYLDAVVFRFIPETESILSAFRARDVDVIQPPPFDETVAPEGAVVQVVAGPVWEHFNFQFGPANRDEESLNQYRYYRQALAYAIDRDAMLEAIGFELELDLEGSQLFFGETLDGGTWGMGLWALVASPGAVGSIAMFDLFDPDAPPPDGNNYYRWGTPDSPTSGDEAVARYASCSRHFGSPMIGIWRSSWPSRWSGCLPTKRSSFRSTTGSSSGPTGPTRSPATR